MGDRIRKKLHSARGFSLGELLVTVLIMSMVASIVAAGIPAASNAYQNVVRASNAELLLSTTISALRNELGTAKDVTVATDKTTVTYYRELESYSELSVSTTDGIMLLRFDESNKFGVDNETGTPVPLVSKAAGDKKNNLYVKYTKAEVEDNIITFSGLCVYKGSTPLTKEDRKVSIRMILD